MNCSSLDLKAYIVGEASAAERQQVESHAAACAGCREELASLALTRDSLLMMRDEEVPRRIAFVSDQVFAPRWWQRVWRSGPQLGFASAAMLSAALLVHAFVRPMPASAPSLSAPQISQAQIEKEVDARVDLAVAKAVAASQAQQLSKTAELLQTAEQRYDSERRTEMAAVAGNLDILYKQVARSYAANNQLTGGQ
ncbi:MAG: zf-HC2 domain-containing protein [Bryobacteraceae bacterium]